MRAVVVDNVDSFTYNLVEQVGRHAETVVVENTASLARVREAGPDAIVVSPGPGHPANDRDVGVTLDVLRELSPTVPTLGVCLGMEAAVHAYGGTVGHAPEPVHGKTSPVSHDGLGVFAGIPQRFRAGRYHSLVATTVPDCFAVTATTQHADARLVMGVRHREHPLVGVQFHPESVLTGVGDALVENFLALASQQPDEPYREDDEDSGDDEHPRQFQQDPADEHDGREHQQHDEQVAGRQSE